MTKRVKKNPIFCDHCNADILPSGIKSCTRQTCATKKLLEQREACAA